jgi:hypothetical protein
MKSFYKRFLVAEESPILATSHARRDLLRSSARLRDYGYEVGLGNFIVPVHPSRRDINARHRIAYSTTGSFLPGAEGTTCLLKQPRGGAQTRPAWTRPSRGSAPHRSRFGRCPPRSRLLLWIVRETSFRAIRSLFRGSKPCFVKARLQCSCNDSRRRLSGIRKHRLGNTG